MNYENGIATLIIHKTEPSDTAVYSCKFSNALGKCETKGKLTIHSK